MTTGNRSEMITEADLWDINAARNRRIQTAIRRELRAVAAGERDQATLGNLGDRLNYLLAEGLIQRASDDLRRLVLTDAGRKRAGV